MRSNHNHFPILSSFTETDDDNRGHDREIRAWHRRDAKDAADLA